MARMDFAHPFTPVSNDAPALPDKLLDRVSRLLDMNCSKIDVEKKAGRNSWSQVNVITPTHNAAGHLTDDGYSIAVALYQAAEFDAEENGYETSRYRGKFWVEDENGKPKRLVASFTINEESREATAPSNDDGDELSLLAHVLGEFRGLLQIQNAHIENQNSRILQMSQDAHASTKPLLALVETLVSHYHTGLNMQSSALQTIYDIERAGAVEQAREQRNAKLLEILLMAAPQALQQFGAFAGSQVAASRGLPPARPLPTAHAAALARARGADGAQAESGVLATAAAGGAPADVTAAPATTATVAAEPVDEAAELRARMEAAPMTTLAHTFRDSLSPIQWLDASQALTKKQLAALRAACTGVDEASTAEGVRELKDQIMGAPKVLAALSEILDEHQTKMVFGMVQVLNQHDLQQGQ